MRYYIVDTFTDKPFGGNPAGVVLLDSDAFPEDRLMQQIASELRYSETAFVKRHSAQEFTIRYFTPKAEVELCGHATIASFFLLHQKGLASGKCLCHTLAGDLCIDAAEPKCGQRYNVMGQPVGRDYKGIVIENGKKIIER